MKSLVSVIVGCLLAQLSFAQNFHSIAHFSKFVPKLQFSHNGKLLAACNMAGGNPVGYVELYDVQQEKIVASIPCDPTFAIFTANDSILWLRLDTKAVAAFDISNLEEPKKIAEFPVEVARCADLSADESRLAIGQDDGQALVFDIKTRQLLASSRPFEKQLLTPCCYNNCKFCPVWGIKLLDRTHYLVAGNGVGGQLKIMDFARTALFETPYLGNMQDFSTDESGRHFLVNCISRNPLYSVPGSITNTGKIGMAVGFLSYTPSGNYIIATASGKLTVFDGEGKKLGSVSDKKYLADVHIAAISADEKHLAFIFHDELIVGDMEEIINKVK